MNVKTDMLTVSASKHKTFAYLIDLIYWSMLPMTSLTVITLGSDIS